MANHFDSELGKHRLLEELATGGMARVYKAYDSGLERIVALKMPLRQYARDPVFVERFLREARTAAKLDHPNIITIFDVDEQGGIPYFTMQYVDRTLQELVEKRGRLPLAEAMPMISQIASALDYAHERGVVHRDVKPTNILINQDGQAILTDFGIAKAADSIRLTRTGEVLGSPPYMSPEQVKGSDVDHRSDIYSLGIVCYEMLVGKPPFEGPTAAVLHAQVSVSPTPLHSANPEVPADVGRVVHKALAKKKEDRYASAGDMARALHFASTGKRVVRPRRQPRASQVAKVKVPVEFAEKVRAALSAIPRPLLVVILGALALVSLLLVCSKPPMPPSPTRTPTGVSTPLPELVGLAPTPTPTHTRVPATPTPTETPVPPTSTPMPTPTCAGVVESQLTAAWDRNRLGCPVGTARTIWAAWQSFERGYMLWRSDTRRVTVFFDNQTWIEFRDQWMEGASIPSRGSPPPGLLAPARGFGYIWGIHDTVASGIGWAVEAEKGFCARIQLLEQGLIFRSSTVTFCQDEMYNWATDPSFRPLFLAVYSDGTWAKR